MSSDEVATRLVLRSELERELLAHVRALGPSLCRWSPSAIEVASSSPAERRSRAISSTGSPNCSRRTLPCASEQ
jgi:hypothetical protein